MQSTDIQLKDFFDRELRILREDASVFGDAYPGAAHALALNQGRSNDPQVELLLQSFAYLVGRLQYQAEVGEASLPNSLMDVLYPHLTAPIPSMLVTQIDAPLAKGVTLERGRQMQSVVTNEQGTGVVCRFRTCYDTKLWPLEVSAVSLGSIDDCPGVKANPQTRSVLKLTIRAQGTQSVKSLGVDRLRLHIDSEQKSALAIYEALAANLTGVAVSIPMPGIDTPPMVHTLDASALHWVGFSEDEAVLHGFVQSHPGYRLIQEYFAFPEKFMFFDLVGLPLEQATDEFEVLFLLDHAPERTTDLTRSVMRLNCTPIINLFSQRIDPISLDHTQYEYHLLADLQNHRYCEIHSIEELLAVRPDAPPRPVSPYYGLEDFHALDQQDYFYLVRHEASQIPGIAGTESYLSFLDTEFDLKRPADEVIGGRALCTNRRLAEKLRIGDSLALEGAAPIRSIQIISKPTTHQTPQLIGERPWALVSQLALNQLSLAQGNGALLAIKELLRMHIGPSSRNGLKQIDGLTGIACRPVVRHLAGDAWRGFVQGIHISLSMDRSGFDTGSVVLFAEVLRRFLALYASVNTLVEVSLETNDVKGTFKAWSPLIGCQAVL